MLKTIMMVAMLMSATASAHADVKDFSSLFGAKKKPAAAAGAQGNWLVHQVNANGAVYTGTLVLTQHGDSLSGRAEWSNHALGSISGRVVNGRLELAVQYSGDLIGYYSAELSGNQLVNGSCQDNKGSQPCTWTARK